MYYNKQQWLEHFSELAEDVYDKLYSKKYKEKNQKEKTKIFNQKMKNHQKKAIKEVIAWADDNQESSETLINELLMLTYCSIAIMLEYRNRIWEYDYMAFSRRIGELWEPFCRLPFEYPICNLSIIKPPRFEEVHEYMVKKMIDYIENLPLDDNRKSKLKEQYIIPWALLDSGNVQLKLDLHFSQNNTFYNCDFKSGFSSNEKGNTNRLLLVGCILSNLGDNYKQIIFVRQNEEDNNHYLQILKGSKYWKVYCHNECYEAIKKFTGFDMRNWLDNNVDWENDLEKGFVDQLKEKDLIKYLHW